MALWPRSSLVVRPDLDAACSHDHPSRFHQDGDDLAAGVPLLCPSPGSCTGASPRVKPGRPHFERPAPNRGLRQRPGGATQCTGRGRSEEHTSELQSLMRISYAVFCLKKKTNTYDQTNTVTQTRLHQRRKLLSTL